MAAWGGRISRLRGTVGKSTPLGPKKPCMPKMPGIHFTRVRVRSLNSGTYRTWTIRRAHIQSSRGAPCVGSMVPVATIALSYIKSAGDRANTPLAAWAAPRGNVLRNGVQTCCETFVQMTGNGFKVVNFAFCLAAAGVTFSSDMAGLLNYRIAREGHCVATHLELPRPASSGTC